MMILRSTAASPFARKVRIAVSVLGLADKIDVRETDLNDPADSIRVQNPLGKIPALILDDGTAYYDSRVIVEYLDHLAGGGRIIPREAKARFEALRLQALCDGILDASLLIVYENRYRPADKHVQSWLDRQADKVTRGLAALEAAPPRLDAGSRCRADRTRLPARLSRPAVSAEPGARIIRGCWPGTTASRRRCRLSRRQKSNRDRATQKPRSELRGFVFGVFDLSIRTGNSARRARCWF